MHSRKAKPNGESSLRLGQITQHIGYLLADRFVYSSEAPDGA